MCKNRTEQMITMISSLKKGDRDVFLKSVQNYFPLCLSIYINASCNLNCRHCDCPKGDMILQGSELTAKEWEEVIKKFSKKGELVCIIGREPLLTPKSRKDTYTVLKTAKKYGLRCGLVNNGHYFQQFIEEYPGAQMDFIDFSIEGLKGTHEKIRADSDFDIVENAIKLAYEGNIAEDIFLATTITRANYQGIEGLVNYFRKIGRFKHIFHTYVPKIKDDGELRINENEYIDKILPLLKGLSENTEILIDVFPQSFSDYPKLFAEIMNGAEFFIDNQCVSAKKGNLSLRFTNSLQSLISIIVIGPDGGITTMEDLRTNPIKSIAGIADALVQGVHPNFATIEKRAKQIQANCFKQNCFLACLGQKADCNSRG